MHIYEYTYLSIYICIYMIHTHIHIRRIFGFKNKYREYNIKLKNAVSGLSISVFLWEG
jgi:hypothetical protein